MLDSCILDLGYHYRREENNEAMHLARQEHAAQIEVDIENHQAARSQEFVAWLYDWVDPHAQEMLTLIQGLLHPTEESGAKAKALVQGWVEKYAAQMADEAVRQP